MSSKNFDRFVKPVTDKIAGLPLDSDLEARLNREFPPDGPVFQALAGACRTGIAEGWLCQREHGGIRFGRPVKPSPETHGYSVDVVEMDDLAGPYHRHPNGEIDMIMPVSGDARFDGRGEGWLVYGPGTEHAPTVSGGKAIILYLLPGGEIEFKKPA